MGKKAFSVWLIGAALLATLSFGCAPTVPATAQQAETPTPTSTATPTAAAKPWLGVMVRDVNKGIAKRLGLEEATGAVIAVVVPGSPAAKAGLRRGDVIRQVNGVEVEGAEEVASQVQEARVGDELTLTIIRDGEEQTITATLAELPPFLRAAKLPPFLSWLKGLEPDEAFEHFLGGELRLKDLEGQIQSLRLVPGVIEGVGEDSLSLTPNGETEAVSFAVSEQTQILKKGGAIPLSEVKAGERALVVALGDEAKLVLLLPEEIKGRPFRPFFEHGMPKRHWGWHQPPRKPLPTWRALS